MSEALNASETHNQRRARQVTELQAILGHVGTAEGTENEILERDSRYDHKYGRLAEELHADYVAQAVTSGADYSINVKGGGVRSGFYVLTKILSYAPKAYNQYSSSVPVSDGTTTELTKMLKNSVNILSVFCNLDINRNHIYEINFGLKQYPPVYEDCPFIIQEDSDGIVRFQASPTSLRYSAIEARAEGDSYRRSGHLSEDVQDKHYCPAVGKVIRSIWNKAIDECGQRPGMFDADLLEFQQQR